MATKADDEELPDRPPPDAQTELDAAQPDHEPDAAASTTEGAEAVVQKLPWEELGLDESYKDAADYQSVAKRLADERKQAEERFNQTLAERQREWQQQTQDFLTQKQWRDEQRAKAEAAQKVEEKKWFDNHGVQPEWFEQFIKTDPETGETKIVGAPPGVEEKMLAFAKHRREHDQRFNYDRQGYFQDALKTFVPDIVREQVQQIFAVQQEQQALAQLENESATWLYQHQDGELLRDPEGNPFLSAVGVDVMGYARQLHQRGLGSQSECFVAARDAIMGRALLAERARSEQAKNAKETSDKRRLDAADANSKRRSNRNGSEGKVETRDAPAQNTSSRAMFSALFDSLASPDGTFDPAAV